MAGNVLKAVITADDGQFAKTLADLQAQLKRFEAQLKNTGNVESFNRIQRAAEATKQKISALNSGAGLQTFVKGQKEAGQAVLDFSRIVQDAPYAVFAGNISAIANNIDPFVNSIQRASAAGGGFSGTLKALGSSLAGGAGIGLAISAVTSALVLFGDKLNLTGSVFKEADFAAADFKKTLEDLSDALTTTKENLEFGSLIRSFNLQISNAKASVNDFRNGLEENQGFGVKIFDLKETIKNNEALISEIKDKAKVIESTQADLIGKIVMRGGDATELFSRFSGADIPDNLIEKLKGQDQELLQEYKDASKKRADLSKQDLEASQNIVKAKLQLALTEFQQQRSLNKQAIDDAEKAVKERERLYDETIAKAKEAASFLNKVTNRKFSFDVIPFEPKADTFRRAVQFLEDAFTNQFKFKFKPDAFKEADKATKEAIQSFLKIGNAGEILVSPKIKLSEFGALSLSQNEIDQNATKTYDELKKRTEDSLVKRFEQNPVIIKAKAQIKLTGDIEKQLQSELSSINQIIGQGIADLASSFGEGLGNILSGKDFGSQIFDVIGGVITSIGKAIIQIGVVRAALDKVLANFFSAGFPPAAIIAIGAAAVAVGAIVKNLKPVQARAKGGPVSGNSPYLVGEKGPELFVPATGGQIINNAALMNAGRSFSGGGQVVRVIGEFVQRGTDLVAVITQTNNSQSRLG